jgi:hypothetical protein
MDLFIQHMGIKYGLEYPGLESLQGREIFLSSETFKQLQRPTLPPKQYVPRFFLEGRGVKRTGRKFSHLLLSSDLVKNEWSYTSTPYVCLRGFSVLFFSYKDTFFIFLIHTHKRTHCRKGSNSHISLIYGTRHKMSSMLTLSPLTWRIW